ncbi:MAG: hypothetical protein HFE63_09160 [Clostridiales bacterium]|nr:hypothetical protein [Clostridiales bacterium]
MNRKTPRIVTAMLLVGMLSSGMAVSAESSVKVGSMIGVAAGTAAVPPRTEDEVIADIKAENEARVQELARIALIDKKLDIIVSDLNAITVNEYIEAHQAAFDEIVALGEDALPYLESIAKEIGVCGWYSIGMCRAYIATAAIYAIKPETYETEYPSPDGKYTFKGNFSIGDADCSKYNNYTGIPYKSISIIENETGEEYKDFVGNFSNISVEWSPDSKYVAFTTGNAVDYSNVFVFDMEHGKTNYMSFEKITKYVEVLTSQKINNDMYWLSLDEWLPNDEVRISIKFCIDGDTSGEPVNGWYIYNLATKRVTSTSFDSAK